MLIHELNLDLYSNIQNIRSKKPNRLIIAQLNINSLRYIFDSLVEILDSNVDILLISKIRNDSSCPTAQFKIEGYTKIQMEEVFFSMLEKTYLPHSRVLNCLFNAFALK